MKLLTEIFGNMTSTIARAIWFSSAAAAISFYLSYAFFYFTSTPTDATGQFLLMLVVQTIFFFLYLIANIHKGFHKHDQEIIGRAFIGLTRKCRIFSSSLELLFDRKFNAALKGFKELEEEYSDTMDIQEQAVLYFYIGRCYDVMGYFPNALRCYQDSQKLGLKDDILPLLIARCTGYNGDVGEAVQLYTSILSNKKSPYRLYVRTDIGKMYLRENDASSAMKWFSEAIEHRQNYADALGGAAVAQAMLHHFKEADELYKAAIVNHISDSKGFTAYYKEVQAAALLETHKENTNNTDNNVSPDTKGAS